MTAQGDDQSRLRSALRALRTGANIAGLLGLSFVVPKQKNLLLFGDGHKLFMGNSKYLYLECLAHDHLEGWFVTDDPRAAREIAKTGRRALDNGSLETFWKILRARHIFVNGVTGDVSVSHFLGRFSVVNLWHGMPMKKILLDDELSYTGNPKGLVETLMNAWSRVELGRMAHIICTNRVMETYMRTAFRNSRTVVTGYPRNDYLFLGETERLRVRAEVGIHDARKVFLYAPTFRDAGPKGPSPFDEAFLYAMNRRLGEMGAVLLVKLHPFAERFRANGYENIRDVSDIIHDIQKLLLAADVLISDYSSVIFDYTIQEKPIISYIYDIESYRAHSREFYFDITEELPGPFCRTQEELLSTMEKIDEIFSDAEYRKRYDSYNAKFNEHRDADSSRRILEMLGLIGARE